MWYFTWILGVTLAATVGILNAMWIEYQLTGAPPESDHE
jgi:cyd operon protein YbgT